MQITKLKTKELIVTEQLFPNFLKLMIREIKSLVLVMRLHPKSKSSGIQSSGQERQSKVELIVVHI